MLKIKTHMANDAFQRPAGSVVMINPVHLLTDDPLEFIAVWRKTAEALRREPGFLDVQLQVRIEPADATFYFVNLAYWESAEACQAALAKHPDIVGEAWQQAPVEAHFAIYQQYEAYAPLPGNHGQRLQAARPAA